MSSETSRRWWHSLGFRLNVWHISVMTLTLLLGALGAHFVMRRSIDGDRQAFVTAELQRRQLRIAQKREDGVEQAVSVESTTQRVFVRVTDERNDTVAYDGAVGERAFARADLRPGQEQRVITTIGDRAGEPWTLTQTQLSEGLWLQIGMDDRPRAVLLHYAERGLWTLLLLGGLLSLVGGALMTRRTLKPLRSLAATSRRILTSEDLDARVVRTGTGDELDELSDLFNQVLDKNQRLVDGMRAALDNVAHDLRTPLSSLRGTAELALAREDDAGRLREALADCVEESDRVLVMLRTLMDISEAETGVMHLDLAEVDLQELCRGVVDMYEHVAEEKEVTLRAPGTEPTFARVDPGRVTQALGNLVDNAIKYCDAGGRVTVGASRDGGIAELTVTDTGIGIDPRDLDRVWERLYRADASRSRRGLGLGLSLVRAIALAHGGSVRAESKVGAGSTFHILLPDTRGREPQDS